jgi:hypothetical protein
VASGEGDVVAGGQVGDDASVLGHWTCHMNGFVLH